MGVWVPGLRVITRTFRPTSRTVRHASFGYSNYSCNRTADGTQQPFLIVNSKPPPRPCGRHEHAATAPAAALIDSCRISYSVSHMTDLLQRLFFTLCVARAKMGLSIGRAWQGQGQMQGQGQGQGQEQGQGARDKTRCSSALGGKSVRAARGAQGGDSSR